MKRLAREVVAWQRGDYAKARGRARVGKVIPFPGRERGGRRRETPLECRQRAGEIPLKQWIHEEAEREGRSVRTIEHRLWWRDWYPNLQFRRANKRTVYVVTQANPTEAQPSL